jgi:hypothetical protein
MPGSKRFNFSQDLLARNYINEQELLIETQKSVLENIQLTKASVAMLFHISQMNQFPRQLAEDLKDALQTNASKQTLITLFNKIHQTLTDIKAKQAPEE